MIKHSLNLALRAVSVWLLAAVAGVGSVRAASESVTVGPGNTSPKVKFYSQEAGELHTLTVTAASGWHFTKGPSLSANPDNLWSGSGGTFQLADMTGRKEHSASVIGKIEPDPGTGSGRGGKKVELPFNVSMITRYFTMKFVSPASKKQYLCLPYNPGEPKVYGVSVACQNAIGAPTFGNVAFSSSIGSFDPATAVTLAAGVATAQMTPKGAAGDSGVIHASATGVDITGGKAANGVKDSQSLTLVEFTTETQATIPTDQKRRKLGVAEYVAASVTPALNLKWTASGQAKLFKPTTGADISFVAKAAKGAALISTSLPDGEAVALKFNVVEPEKETAIKTTEDFFFPGVQGAGMRLTITVQPDDVSFSNVECREMPGPATNITGYFLNKPASSLYHDPNAQSTTEGWFELGEKNEWFDDAYFGHFYPPWTPGGGWQWVIPVQWRVPPQMELGSSPKPLPDRLQVLDMTSDGTSTVTKLNQSVTRSPSPPTTPNP